jgi:hypothetical protein
MTTMRLTERLFDLFSGSYETEIDESGNTNASNHVPFELFDELEQKREQVDPHDATGGASAKKSYLMQWGGKDVLSYVGRVTARKGG